MPTVIKHKIGSGAPLASDLVEGELGIDTVNGRAYTENSVGSIVELGTSPSTIDINAGTVDGISSLSTANGTDVSFAGVSGTKFFWDASAESLGIGQGVYSTTHALNLKGEGLAIKNDKNGSDNNWSTINNTDTGSSSNLSFSTGGKVDAVVFSHAGNVGIGTSSPSAALDVVGEATVGNGTYGIKLSYSAGSTAGVIDTADSATNLSVRTGGTERMRIDSSGNVGIGTSSPNKLGWDSNAKGMTIFGNQRGFLEIGSDSPIANDQCGSLGFMSGSTMKAQIRCHLDGSSNGNLAFSSNGTERLRIDSSGNVGIGTNSPNKALTVKGEIRTEYLSSAAQSYWGTASNKVYLGTSEAFPLAFETNGTERMRIDSSGNVGIGTSSPADKFTVDSGQVRLSDGYGIRWGDASVGIYGNGSSEYMQFNTASTERARIDSSGNLLVGKTTADNTTVGFTVYNDNGYSVVRDSNPVGIYNRLTTDGDIAVFRKDGTTVGSIGTNSAVMYIGSDDVGFRFDATSNAVSPWNTTSAALNDGGIDIGRTTARFRNLYLSGGVYLGGTGAANHLDDYEEGTWTPVIEGATTAGTATYTVQEGNYTKVGRIVTITCNLAWTGHTGTGSMLLSGFPFNAFNDVDRRSTAAAHYNAFTVGSGKELGLLLSSSTSKLSMYANDPTGGNNTTLSVLASCGYLAITMTYQAA